MYLPITGDDLFYKHHDGCGDVKNHIMILGITVIEEIYQDEFEEPIYYICDVDMTWKDWGQGMHVYTYPDIELEDPDDYDAALDAIAEQVK